MMMMDEGNLVREGVEGGEQGMGGKGKFELEIWKPK